MNAIVYISYLCYSIHKSGSEKSDSPKKEEGEMGLKMKARNHVAQM